ncbi:glycerol-3-phosphate dehydrogenase/oxidase [Bremerella sp. P1]|uniref:glycerol-3-phosphate dehydrogenase/oxidase n=1 Tax=Bremerella sp. P1 TaxID=3026424 RepID=UPI002368A809|nr:glycerol-3-phosphate dehydrogenase/oxidase [Bremerella sp. P1]WDI42436.1 glycerol-3-phosphate dehydrogenase/oxidase [Bremerella sp. P1]
MAQDLNPVLILGAGINGAALARELLLNRVPVVLIDHADIASGTTSWSSRLIHGGLRYLEHGEASLVYESLAERERFLSNSPEHVSPLELMIPVKSQFAGLISSAAGFFNLPIFKSKNPSRGAWAIRSGLTMYDFLAGSQNLGSHKRMSQKQWKPIGFDASFVDVFSYYDGQIEFPELYVSTLIHDCEEIAQQHGIRFTLRTYRRPKLNGKHFEFENLLDFDAAVEALEPSALVNASGPSGDETLQELGIRSDRLFGGTRGSHLISHKPILKEALGPRGIYAEAFDGRPVFILPWNGGVLIGTTDIRHEGDPEVATASQEEIDYLLKCVNSVLPGVELQHEDIVQHYSGVRPLPYVPAGSTASIPRGHWLHEHTSTPWPCYTIVGGKLTTCRSLAEHSAKTILKQLGQEVVGDSKTRKTYEGDPPKIESGQRARFIMQHLTGVDAVSDTQTLAEAAISQLHAKTLADVVERRLMLVFHPGLSRSHLSAIADALITDGKLSVDVKQETLEAYIQRLQSRFGKQVLPD